MAAAVATFPGATIGARVRAKNKFVRAALASASVAVEEPVVDEISKALVVTGVETSGGRRHKMKGGTKTTDAIAQLIRDCASGVRWVADLADSATAGLITKLPTAVVAGAGLVAVNNPNSIANIAALGTEIAAGVTNATIRTTYGDWVAAMGTIGAGLASAGGALAAQVAQGPVVPFALAALVTYSRAKKNGVSWTDQIKADAAAAFSTAARGVTGALQTVSTEAGKFQKARTASAAQTFGELPPRVRAGIAAGEGPPPLAARGVPLGDAEQLHRRQQGEAAQGLMALGRRGGRRKKTARKSRKSRMTRRR